MSINRTLWTSKEVQTLTRMAAEGYNSNAIGEFLGRQPAGVRARALRLGIPLGGRGHSGKPLTECLDPFKSVRKDAEIGSKALLKAQIRARQVFVTRRAA